MQACVAELRSVGGAMWKAGAEAGTGGSLGNHWAATLSNTSVIPGFSERLPQTGNQKDIQYRPLASIGTYI